MKVTRFGRGLKFLGRFQNKQPEKRDRATMENINAVDTEINSKQTFERNSNESSLRKQPALSPFGASTQHGKKKQDRSPEDRIGDMVAWECDVMENMLLRLNFHPSESRFQNTMTEQLPRHYRTDKLLSSIVNNLTEPEVSIPDYRRYRVLAFRLAAKLKEVEGRLISAGSLSRENERGHIEQGNACQATAQVAVVAQNATIGNTNMNTAGKWKPAATVSPVAGKRQRKRANLCQKANVAPKATPERILNQTPPRTSRSRSQNDANSFKTPETQRIVSKGCARHTAERRATRARRVAERRAQEEQEAAEARKKVLQARRAAYNRALRKKASEAVPLIETGRPAAGVQTISACA